ncbi:MAG: hypothetical protein JWN84_2342 [Nocardioides sp.]|nr:hypothetical protein [Nocardioides sp.]
MATSPNDTATNNFGTHMPDYQRGRAWMDAVLSAVVAQIEDDQPLAERYITEADRLLGPLGEEPDPDLLRDFIAGAHRQAEDHLLPDEDDLDVND